MIRGWLLVFAVVLASGASYAQAPDLGTEAQREAGRRIYEQKCAQCHGIEGDGNGIAKAFFQPAPRDFTSGLFKIRTTASGELPTDDDLKRVIRNGMPYTGMPSWRDLSDEELSNVVYYIKTFVEDFADPDFLGQPIRIPKAPRYSEESAEQGRKIYEDNKCADCHGELGRGYGKSATTLKDEWGRPLRPADLTKRWTFRGGSTREDIYRTFTTGLNGTPMPSFAELIAEEDRWHLVDYVYSFSRDEPDYSTVVVASVVEGEIDLAQGESVFENAPAAFFPVFGQIIEPGRNFDPSVDAIEVRAVYNATEIAIMLTWHDMTAETSGLNLPFLPVPPFAERTSEDGLGMQYSDAVAIQTPSQNVHGFVKPYFLFGDAKNPMDIWFADLAKDGGELLSGRGSGNVAPTGEAIATWSGWQDGAWNVIFKRNRHPEEGFSFEDGTFVPVSFSVWDGFNKERGSKRGVTGWYHV